VSYEFCPVPIPKDKHNKNSSDCLPPWKVSPDKYYETQSFQEISQLHHYSIMALFCLAP
jgi:hypothetical protein